MTAHPSVDPDQSLPVAEHAAPPTVKPTFLRRVRAFFRAFSNRFLSSLTRRIVTLNLAGLIALVIGILQLSEIRSGLIDSRVQSLIVQGEIMAAAIASSATVETDAIRIDPERLLELQIGETAVPLDDAASILEFPINPERVAPVLRRLTGPTSTQARIYDREGLLVLDSRNLYGRGDILRFDLPAIDAQARPWERLINEARRLLRGADLPLYKDLGFQNGRGYPEVLQALAGSKTSIVRVNERGQIIVSVAVPIQRFRGIRGALLLNTQGGDIDAIIDAERLAVIKVFGVSAIVMVLLSFLLAGTIAGPVRKLSDAAERVRRRVRVREEIPDFTNRGDEIGHLSGALREMTDALYQRIEAIERFAADVAHELKNPLTSLRSAVETLPLAKSEQSRTRLLEVIDHDVRRLDRLISDISDASRLDAELQRQDSEPVDMHHLLTTIISMANETSRHSRVPVVLTFDGAKKDFLLSGHDSRLGQVITNLIDNARSFSPADGTVRVTAQKQRKAMLITVEDDGPGIRPDALERIFERFYTDRPHQDYGQNSGLGLSISKQIVEAHGGTIHAENRVSPAGKVLGARFVIVLPVK